MNSETPTLEFPDKGLLDRNDYELYLTRRPSVILAVEREVVDPVLIRNGESDRAETQIFHGTTHAQSNPEKFTTKERLTGLDFLRAIDEHNELISDEYRYNEPPALPDAVNMDTITYGVSGTGGGQEYSIKSRLTAGYTYTVGEYDVLNSETRNAVYESGTMKNEDGEQSQALFDIAHVQPGNSFVQFLQLEAATPGMLAYVLYNVLNTRAYGARETRRGKNIENHVRAIVLSDFPEVISNGEFLKLTNPSPDNVGPAIGSYLETVGKTDWESYGDDTVDNLDAFPEWFEELLAAAGRQTGGALDALRDVIAADTEVARHALLDE